MTPRQIFAVGLYLEYKYRGRPFRRYSHLNGKNPQSIYRHLLIHGVFRTHGTLIIFTKRGINFVQDKCSLMLTDEEREKYKNYIHPEYRAYIGFDDRSPIT